MRAELVTLARVERALKERPEYRWLNVLPVGAARRDEQVKLRSVERQRLAVLEESAVELYDLLLEDGRITARVHRRPERANLVGEDFDAVALNQRERLREAFVRDKAHVLREHREDCAHEKVGNALRSVAG